MPPKKNPAAAGDSWILVWSDTMIDIFHELLEGAHNNGKRSNTGFKREAWVEFRAGIQNVYLGNKHITVGKISYICVLNRSLEGPNARMGQPVC